MDKRNENFKRVAEKRTNKIIDMINLLGNLSNRSFYNYSDNQIDEIFNAIQSELDLQRLKFNKDRTNKRVFKL
jgi:hypothetical protein